MCVAWRPGGGAAFLGHYVISKLALYQSELQEIFYLLMKMHNKVYFINIGCLTFISHFYSSLLIENGPQNHKASIQMFYMVPIEIQRESGSK